MYVLLQSKILVSACQTPRNKYLENFKSINVQNSNIQLLMILHHGFVDGLKSKGCVSKILIHYIVVTNDSIVYGCAVQTCAPRPGSQTRVNAELWRARHVCNTPAPRSASRR